MRNQLQMPFSDIVGDNSAVQKAIAVLWSLIKNKPATLTGIDNYRATIVLILIHLLGLMKSTGLANMAGCHSAAITMFRAIEDATDCFAAVAINDKACTQWCQGKLRASEAAIIRTESKQIQNPNSSLSEYRKTIRKHLNAFSHCAPSQTHWNIYLESIGDSQCTTELNAE